MRPDAAFQRRVLRVFEDMLDQPPATRGRWLESTCDSEPAVRDAVHAMADAAAASSSSLPTAPPEPLTIAEDEAAPERIGHYKIIRMLGSGGMGIVYLGERDDGLFEHKVAIKVMRRTLFSEQALVRFASERRILAKLRHPHIAQMLDGGAQPDGAPFIVMELIGGRPITEHCDQHRLDLAARLHLFAQVADAIQHAHRNLIVHADIKPSNVVVEDDFGVKLLDFGVARLLDESEDGRHEGYTSGYASPARMDGLPATPADDIYAAGVLLGELAGEQPEVDDDLRAVIARAAAPDGALRYGAVSELVDDLARWRMHRPVRAAPSGRARRAFLFWRRHRVSLSVSVSAALALLVALVTISTLYVQSEGLRATADKRYTASVHMADYIIGSTDPALARAPGTLAARKELVEQTSTYLRNLESSRSPSPALMREVAAGYLRMAKIYGLDPSGGIGDMQAAQASLHHADSLIASAAQKEPDAPDLLWLRGQARLLQATKVFIVPTADVARQSLTASAEARSYLERYLKLRPHDTEAQLALWSAEIIPERAYYYLGQYLKGLPDIENHLDLERMPVQTFAQRKERDFITNGSYLLLGEGYADTSPKKARTYFDRLIDGITVLQRRGDSDWENDLTQASGLVDRAKLEAGQGDLTEALRDNRAAIASLQQLYSIEHNKSMALYLSFTRLGFASLLARVNRLAEARTISSENIAWLHRYIAEDRSDPSRQRVLALALTGRATMEDVHGGHMKACAAAREATIIWRAVKQHHGLVASDNAPEGALARTARLSAQDCPAGAS